MAEVVAHSYHYGLSSDHTDGEMNQSWRDHLLLVGDHVKAATSHLLLAVWAGVTALIGLAAASCSTACLGILQALWISVRLACAWIGSACLPRSW